MILTCERCETRFRLDESRLPAKGARVRCSRCKHAFLVRPPGATPAAAIEQLAAEAAQRAKPGSVDVAWDLDESADPGATQQRAPRSQPVEPPGELEDESEWRFEGEVPELGGSGASLDLPNGEARAPSAEADGNESSFAQLGDPESWDLLSSSTADASAPVAIGGLAAPASPVAEPVAPAPRGTTAPESQAAPEPEAERIEAPPIQAREPEPRVRALGIAATALLAALTLAGGLRSSSAQVPDSATLGSLAVEKLRVRIVDNAWVGALWVVSGELHNPTGEPLPPGGAPVVVLLDATGAPIEGATALAQPALDATRLELEDPTALQSQSVAAVRELAERAARVDGRVAFDAVFASAPRNAARFALDTRPLPQQPPANAPAGAEPPSS